MRLLIYPASFLNTDGVDFTAMMVDITIAAANAMACTDIPIMDDEIALEEDKIFEVTLDAPVDIPAPSDPSTVTIMDDDGKTCIIFLVSIFPVTNFSYISKEPLNH